MVKLTQEVICIGVVAIVCFILSTFCFLLWCFRCRNDNLRHRQQQEDRQMEIDNFQSGKRHRGTPFQTRKIEEEKKETVKRQKTHEGKEGEMENGSKRHLETIGQFEQRVKTHHHNYGLEQIPEVDTPVKHKRLDTVSVIASGSTETLQRNDSKVNVFPADKTDDMDYNPGLSGPIDLERI